MQLGKPNPGLAESARAISWVLKKRTKHEFLKKIKLTISSKDADFILTQL